MTIAAGFLTRGGVLLCADTKHSTSFAQSHHSKIMRYEIGDFCKLTCAVAGHVPAARMAVQDCRAALAKEQPQDFETVREILKETVGEVNWSYVDRDPEKGLRFDLLMCVWLASKKKACLFTTSGPVVEEVEDFDMRGTGADIARYAVSMSGFSSAMHMAKVANIARTALAAAKSFDAWCGGQSTLTGIRHSDGELWGQALHYQDDPTEAFINGFWRHCGGMLTDLVSPKLSGKAIDELVNELRSDIKRLHSQWAARQKTAIYSARIIAIGDDPADAPSPRSTKADQ